MTAYQRLSSYAKNSVYPYLIQTDLVKEHIDTISILLVGSTATGLCDENSDIDICLLCDDETFSKLSVNTNWETGKPTQIRMDNIQVHYYAVPVGDIIRKLSDYDDSAFYVYGTAVPFHDGPGFYQEIKRFIDDDNVKVVRFEKSTDMLIRRRRALDKVLSIAKDPIMRAEIGIEIIRLILKSAALKDGIHFDPRKRLFETALNGVTGQSIKEALLKATVMIGELSDIDNRSQHELFLSLIDCCIQSVL